LDKLKNITFRKVAWNEKFLNANYIGSGKGKYVHAITIAGIVGTAPVFSPEWWDGLLWTKMGTYHKLPLRTSPPEGSSQLIIVSKPDLVSNH
jgi:hypothetical protein